MNARVPQAGRLQLRGPGANRLHPPQVGRHGRDVIRQVDRQRHGEAGKDVALRRSERRDLLAQVAGAGLTPRRAKVVRLGVLLDHHFETRVDRRDLRDLVGEAIGISVPCPWVQHAHDDWFRGHPHLLSPLLRTAVFDYKRG